MKILSVTAQKPESTGSGVYLTELVRGFEKKGIGQAVIAGVTKADQVSLPEGVKFYPVYFESEKLPYPITGMSDEMPYTSTKYSDLTDEMTEAFKKAFEEILKKAVDELNPDVILCHHLYLLTSLVRELYPEKKVYGVSHGSDLRQIRKTKQNREYILQMIPELDGIFALHEEQKEIICRIYGESVRKKVSVIGTGYNSDVFRQEAADKEKSERELKLIFAGKITQQELAKKINQSDIFVLPSFYEGLPLVIIEALACGAYVICTDLPGIQNWVNQNLPDNGVVFVEPPERINEDEPVEEALPVFERELEEAIRRLSENPGSRPSREHLERISWDGLCGRLMEVFEKHS